MPFSSSGGGGHGGIDVQDAGSQLDGSAADGGASDAGSLVCEGSCDIPHGTAECSSGNCVVNCITGYADCDGDLGNGCETALDETANCGSCGALCDNPHGTTSCVSGACVASCDVGFGDCDGRSMDGCETSLASTTIHCGACGNACTNGHGTTSCSAGSCVPSCSSGWDDCDANAANGCETALTSVSNCGMCNNTCPSNGGTPVCNAGACSVMCDLSGTFALKITLPATWPNTTYLKAGSGTFTLWALAQWTQAGTNVSGSLALCGKTVPDFTGVTNEKYGIDYPNSLFDGTPLPGTTTSATIGATSPGSSFTLARSALIMGVSMSDPINGAWPALGSTTSLDSDADGKPGLTATYKNGSGYSLIPVNVTASSRAQSGYMGLRVVLTLSGTLTTCTQSSGSATAQDIDIHTQGCRISGNSRDCDGTETSYMDGNAPNYQTQPASYSLVKLANGATCAGVRSALP